MDQAFDRGRAIFQAIADFALPHNGGRQFRRETGATDDRPRHHTGAHTPPGIPQYNGVAERALGPIKEKSGYAGEDNEGGTLKLRAEMISMGPETVGGGDKHGARCEERLRHHRQRVRHFGV